MHCLILTEEHFVRESVRLVLDVLLPTSRICAMGGRVTEPPRCEAHRLCGFGVVR